MLIGMAAAECSHKDSAGAATGFVGLFATWEPLWRVIHWHLSWSITTGPAFFYCNFVCSGCSGLITAAIFESPRGREPRGGVLRGCQIAPGKADEFVGRAVKQIFGDKEVKSEQLAIVLHPVGQHGQ